MMAGDQRGQLAMAVVEAAIAAMLILAVLSAMVGIPAGLPPTEAGLDATAAAVVTTLGEQPHRAAVRTICQRTDPEAEAQVAAAVAAMQRPGVQTQVRVGETEIGPSAPAGPRGHDVLLLPGCRVQVWVWMV